MSRETFELIDKLRRAGRRSAMATLVRTIGTTPRKEGAKMFVGDDGGIFGSVTIGGCVDARVIEEAAEALGASAPRLLNMQLGDEEAWEIGLTCGGAVDVFVEPLSDHVAAMYETAQRELESGKSIGIATKLTGDDAGTRTLLTGDDVPRASRTEGDVYVEVFRPPVNLLIFGASAVAIPLVAYARELGFRTVIVDGRERFATRERFPEADEIRIGIASEIAGQMGLGPTTPVVLVAHDYKIDIPVLKKALAADVPYIGLLGSRRRGGTILQMLRDDGVSDADVERVRVPIGLDLGGDTAAEIALSIASEVVAVMHGRSGAALSKRA